MSVEVQDHFRDLTAKIREHPANDYLLNIVLQAEKNHVFGVACHRKEIVCIDVLQNQSLQYRLN